MPETKEIICSWIAEVVFEPRTAASGKGRFSLPNMVLRVSVFPHFESLIDDFGVNYFIIKRKRDFRRPLNVFAKVPSVGGLASHFTSLPGKTFRCHGHKGLKVGL